MSPSPGIAVLVPSNILAGRLKLEGNLDPLCRKGRNLKKDASDLDTSIQTRWDEITALESSPDINRRSLAGDPGHLDRIALEEIALQRCRDNCPDKKPEPEREPILAWPPKDVKKYAAPVGVTATVLVVVGAVALAPETGGLSLAALIF